MFLGFARLYTGCFCQNRHTLKQFMWLFWLHSSLYVFHVKPHFFSYRPMKKGAEAWQKQSKPKEQHTASGEHLRWPQQWPILLCIPVVRPYYLKDPHTPCTILQVMQGVPPCNFIDRKFCHSRHALQQATRLLLILNLYIYLFVFIGFIWQQWAFLMVYIWGQTLILPTCIAIFLIGHVGVRSCQFIDPSFCQNRRRLIVERNNCFLQKFFRSIIQSSTYITKLF